jgi:hypothetical protein
MTTFTCCSTFLYGDGHSSAMSPILVRCKTKGVVASRGGVRLTTQLASRSLIANYCTRWCCNLKGSHRMGDGRIFLKNSALFSLTTTYGMSLISAGPDPSRWTVPLMVSVEIMIYRKKTRENPLTCNENAALVKDLFN